MSRLITFMDLGSDHYKEWRLLLAYRAGCPPKPRREQAEPPEAPDTAPQAVSGRRGRKPQLHLPIEQQLEVVELYKAGVSVKEIAERFHIHRATVSEICNRRCVALRNESRGLTREQVQGAALRYVQGASLATVAKEFGSTPTTIRTALMAAGIEMRPARGGNGKRAHISRRSSGFRCQIQATGKHQTFTLEFTAICWRGIEPVSGSSGVVHNDMDILPQPSAFGWRSKLKEFVADRIDIPYVSAPIEPVENEFR